MIRAASLVLAMSVVTLAQADTVWLKNGGTIDGTVVTEAEDHIVVDIGGGKVTLQRSEIERIERSGKVDEPPRREERPPAEGVKPPVDEEKPPAADLPTEPPDEESGPRPEQVGTKEATVYASKGRLNLLLKVVQPEGAAIRLRREECRIDSWSDDHGATYDASKAEFSGFSMYDGPEGSLSAMVDGSPDAGVESCHVAGTMAYRLGWARREGRTDPVDLSEGTQFEMEGIPFTLSLPERPFATEEELRTRTWIELRCPYGDFEPGDFVFLTSVTFADESGATIPSRDVQLSEWSDVEGNAGFFFIYDLEGRPAAASLQYKMWRRMKTMTVPFDVSAPIRR